MRWLFLFAVFPIFGAYIGNPADPAIMNTGFFSGCYPFFKFTSGYIYDYTQNKRFVAHDQTIKRFGLHSQMASFSFIFIERLQLFGTAGGSKETVVEKPLFDMVVDVHTNYHFSWGAGGKIILFQWGQTFISGDFIYFAIPSSHKSYFQFLNRLNLPLDTGKQEFSLREWEASVGLSSRFAFLTPYVGVSYLRSKLHADLPYRNDLDWGYFYGLTISLTGRLHVNAERRVRNESAYTLSTIAVF
ncbi:MAG: hypothetical protein KGQ49_03035 [Verrucomicrobia bacterium]|nr:hypothetical protein [Verrucomicrobiota bacterium]MBU6446357.1 hypothetical protein [Verrucomicrobiota bacterium]MDE3047537.1 hypothetical protein [Verrucomicrobiota bacterium]